MEDITTVTKDPNAVSYIYELESLRAFIKYPTLMVTLRQKSDQINISLEDGSISLIDKREIIDLGGQKYTVFSDREYLNSEQLKLAVLESLEKAIDVYFCKVRTVLGPVKTKDMMRVIYKGDENWAKNIFLQGVRTLIGQTEERWFNEKFVSFFSVYERRRFYRSRGIRTTRDKTIKLLYSISKIERVLLDRREPVYREETVCFAEIKFESFLMTLEFRQADRNDVATTTYSVV